MAKDKIFIVVPAFNEGTVVGQVVKSLNSFGTVVVVDDGSSDTTSEVSSAANATVLRHVVNLGQGAALQTGIDYAYRQNADYIVTFDADGQHDPDDIPKLLSVLKESHADIVLGSRFLGTTVGMTATRRSILNLARIFTSATSGITTTDVHNGFRVLNRKAAGSIRLAQNRMAHASELISQIKLNNLTYAEGPVTIRYTNYSRAKGQRTSAMFTILFDLFTAFLRR